MEAALGTLSSLAFSGSGDLVSVSPPAGCVCVAPLFLRGSAVPPCWMSQHEVVSPTDGVPEEDGRWHERCLSMQ